MVRSSIPARDKPRVLIAENDDATAAVLRHRLERDGADVTVCTDGKSALLLTESERFDLLVLGASLAGLDGFGVLQELKDIGLAAPPTVLVCWPGNDAYIARAFALGAADVLIRPFSLTEARARLGRFLPRMVA